MTLLFNLLFSSAQAAQQTSVKVAMKMDVWDLILQSGMTVKFVLILLIVFSVLSWAIIFAKKMQLSRVGFMDAKFLDYFWKSEDMDEIFSDLERFRSSSLAQIFKAGYNEMQRIAASKKGGTDNVSRALRKASDNEIAKLENRTGFLATVGSTAPFIGLFGTVWGIMTAFQNIGSVGSASLAVVAPGISEALITTAVGLAAAIPAVMAYNYFVGKFKKHDLEISNFNADFLNMIKRNSFEG